MLYLRIRFNPVRFAVIGCCEAPTPLGVFTSLLVNALKGAASNLLGDVMPGRVYAHIDQSLASWEQRPVFQDQRQGLRLPPKGDASHPAPGTAADHRLLPEPGMAFQLNPSFEPGAPRPTRNTQPRSRSCRGTTG